MEETNIVVEETTQEMAGASEILTFDEILADKYYQSEFDKRVAKALETAKTNWEKEAERQKLLESEKVSEAEKLAKMNDLEKAQYEANKERKLRIQAEKERDAVKLKDEIKKQAVKLNIPINLLDFYDYENGDAESAKKYVETLNTEWESALEKAINEKSKEKTPKYVVDEGAEVQRRPRESI